MKYPRWRAECFWDIHPWPSRWRWRTKRWFWRREDAREWVRAMNDPGSQVFKYRVRGDRAEGQEGK